MHYPLNEYFKLFSDCSIVAGYRNSILLDFTRPNMSNFVPKELNSFIEACGNMFVGDVLNQLNNNDKLIAVEYLDFMIKNEFGFFVSEALKENFPLINMDLKKSPEIIDNCIIEIDSTLIEYLKTIHVILEKCLVSSVEIRVKDMNYSDLKCVIESFSLSIVQSINIYLDSKLQHSSLEELNKLIDQNTRIKKIIVFGNENLFLKESEVIQTTSRKFNEKIIVRANIINLSYHIESQNVCTYRYKKLFIAYNGDLKNYDCNRVIGNLISDNTENLIEILSLELVKNEDWYLTKCQINVCCDCEFRTVCFTNNLPEKNKKGGNYLANECTYNPYIGKSKEEIGYKDLKSCGVICDNEGFTIDHKKIEEINQELWGE